MFDNRIKIGVTQGDTNGVGWEVILKALANPMVVELCTPIIYGNRKAAEFYTSLIDMEDIEPPLHSSSRSTLSAPYPPYRWSKCRTRPPCDFRKLSVCKAPQSSDWQMT